MPTNNFKLFDENKANLLTDTEYANATQRLNGVQTGVASSQLNNKFAYQVSLVAYSIAQLMNANGLDASDTLAVSAFVGNLQGTLLQKVADKATTAEAAAGVLSNKYITPETMKAAALLLSGGVMSGMLDMGNNRITNLGTPTADSDAVTKEYVDGNSFKFFEIFDNNYNYSSATSVDDITLGSRVTIPDTIVAFLYKVRFNSDVVYETNSNRTSYFTIPTVSYYQGSVGGDYKTVTYNLSGKVNECFLLVNGISSELSSGSLLFYYYNDGIEIQGASENVRILRSSSVMFKQEVYIGKLTANFNLKIYAVYI